MSKMYWRPQDDIEIEAVLKENSGVMVACMLPKELADQLVVEGGEPSQNLHLTLAYLGKKDKLSDEQKQRLHDVVAAHAKAWKPLDGKIGGVGRFMASETSDGMDVVYASYDAPSLPAFRQRLVEELKKAGLPVNEKHGYTPHITLAYLDPEKQNPLDRVFVQEAPFDKVSVVYGDEVMEYPLEGTDEEDQAQEDQEEEEAPVEISPEAHDAFAALFAAALGMPPEQLGAAVEKELDGDDLPAASVPGGMQFKVVKAMSEEKRLVYGEVLVPEVVDSQGDIISAEEIEKAAHNYLRKSRLVGYRHSRKENAEVVESYIAPFDMDFGEGKKVIKGTWIMAAKVLDDAAWEQVKRGELNGWSIGAWSESRPEK